MEGSRSIAVLFVCTANICRSAYAEVIARHLAGARTDVVFSSAGTDGFTAQPMNPEMAGLLPDGVPFEDFSSRKVTSGLIESADVVLTAEAWHRTVLIELYPRSFRKVLTLGQFAEAAGRSELRSRELIAAVGRQRPPSRPEHDISDPFRRGAAANAHAASLINRALEIVVPALTGQTQSQT